MRELQEKDIAFKWIGVIFLLESLGVFSMIKFWIMGLTQ